MVITGVIRPPPEIRAVANRTALYVAKNGRAFESRILGSAKGRTPKFAFLHDNSPFHAYYEDRIQFYENGGEDEKEEDVEEKKVKAAEELKKKKEQEESRKKEKTQTASVVDPVAKAVLTQRQKIIKLRATQQDQAKAAASDNETEENQKTKAKVTIPPPPQIHFLNIICPSSLTIAQIERIQLVAQFAALEGKGGPFLQQLTAREWRNPAFAFCQPRHGHFAYFSALVDAYRRVLGLWTGGNKASSDDGVKAMANNVDHCLQVAAYRSEYARDEVVQRRKQDEDGVLSGAAQIDWHVFVVVETIEFPADEVVELSMLPPPPTANVPSTAAAAAAQGEGEGDGAMDESDGEEEQIRVVPSYTPKVVARQSNSLEMVIDPISGKSVAVKDMPEHMRIQLLDPKWAEERKKFQAKQKDSNLVSGDVVANNIARFAQARGDVFGKTEHNLLNNEKDSKARLEEANRVIRESRGSTVGPSLPQPAGTRRTAPPLDHASQPATKRPKMDLPQAPALPTTVVLPPPPLPPQGFQNFASPSAALPEQPFATPFEPTAAAALTEPTTGAKDILSESDFAASLDNPQVTLQIRIPNEPTQMAYNFYGQILSVQVDVMLKVKAVKQEVSSTHLNNMPANKIQLKSTASGAFLKDNMTLAALNIGPTATLELVPRARGGRK